MAETTLEMNLTLLVGREGTRIEVRDELSRQVFLRLEVDPTEFAAALGREAAVKCRGIVANADRVGKQQEMQAMEFPLGAGIRWEDRKALAVTTAPQFTPDGWVADTYYGAQDSFFQRGGKEWARTNIRRWVAVQPESEAAHGR